MNPTLSVIENRRSVRNFSKDPLSEAEKEAIVHAAMRAPTAGNLMLYTILEIEDQSLKDQLAVSCDNQPFIAKAPYLLLFAADYQRQYDYYQYCNVEAHCQERGVTPRPPQEGDMLLACCDALIAAQNAVIAAESMGIGSCYIGDIIEKYEFHRDLLQLPRYVLPITLVCFGRPAVEKAEKRLVPRYDRRFVVYKDTYHRLSPDEFNEMMQPTATHNFPDLPLAEAVKTLGEKTYFRKFASEFSAEMTRSAREMIKNWH